MIKKKTAKDDRVIKSLVTPQEVVFRFPFQLEVDWAFEGRSAVKSELHMHGARNIRATRVFRCLKKHAALKCLTDSARQRSLHGQFSFFIREYA